MDKLINTVMGYDWGSRTAIARLMGRERPSPGPEAELWIGAHAVAPSRLARPATVCTLEEEISSRPDATLGGSIRARFGDKLPFLLKVLAAEFPLSLQAHPSASQARIGYDREEKLGIPLGARNRNYKDSNPKPELLCAIEPFEALCGFRTTSETVALFEALEVPGLSRVVGHLKGAGAVRAAFGSLMTMEARAAALLVEEVRAACGRLSDKGSPHARQLEWVERLAAQFPGDVGVVSSLLLNYVRLDPGEAVTLPAGNLHSYLKGTGVEIMAASDNVLRGGLTSKHVDVDELLAVLDFRDGPFVCVPTRPLSTTETEYVTEHSEFRLTAISLADVHAYRPERRGPELLLCTSGEARAALEGEPELVLAQGESAFVGAADGPYELRGQATLFRATVGSFDG